MAVGETSGQSGESAPRRLITAGGGRRTAGASGLRPYAEPQAHHVPRFQIHWNGRRIGRRQPGRD